MPVVWSGMSDAIEITGHTTCQLCLSIDLCKIRGDFPVPITYYGRPVWHGSDNIRQILLMRADDTQKRLRGDGFVSSSLSYIGWLGADIFLAVMDEIYYGAGTKPNHVVFETFWDCRRNEPIIIGYFDDTDAYCKDTGIYRRYPEMVSLYEDPARQGE